MGECILHGNGGGGGASLNFKVVGGTSAPSSPTANTIWVNTDTAITGWHFGADEPNVYDLKTNPADQHQYYALHVLSAGDILNFVIPQTCSVYDWIRINGIDGKLYGIRYADGRPVTSWNAGVKVGVVISNEKVDMGGTEVFLAKLLTYGSYYHEEGTVWIQTGTTSLVAFNALKKNGIQVCPISANQYVNGAWVAKTAQTYQGGAWVDWIHPDIAKIYNLTEVRENGTGGATIAVGQEIVLTSTSAGSAQGYVAFYSAEKIDLTNYSKLTFKGSRSSFGQAFMVGFRTANTRYWNWGDYANDIAASVMVETTEATYSVDVSSLNGSYYFFANFAGQTSAGTATMTLSDFELT